MVPQEGPSEIPAGFVVVEVAGVASRAVRETVELAAAAVFVEREAGCGGGVTFGVGWLGAFFLGAGLWFGWEFCSLTLLGHWPIRDKFY